MSKTKMAKEKVEVNNAEKELVFRALSAYSDTLEALQKKNEGAGVKKAVINVSDTRKGVEELKQKFL